MLIVRVCPGCENMGADYFNSHTHTQINEPPTARVSHSADACGAAINRSANRLEGRVEGLHIAVNERLRLHVKDGGGGEHHSLLLLINTETLQLTCACEEHMQARECDVQERALLPHTVSFRWSTVIQGLFMLSVHTAYSQ